MTDALVYTIPEAAKLLRISKDLAYDEVKAGRIPSVTFGTRRLVPKAALDEMLAEAARQSTAAAS